MLATAAGVVSAVPVMSTFMGSGNYAWSVVEFSNKELAEHVLPQLAKEDFGDGYAVSIERAGKPEEVVYRSTSPMPPGEPDDRAILFRTQIRRPPGEENPQDQTPEEQGLWELKVHLAGGSLSDVVESGRRRNRLLSFGTLGVLGLGFAFLAIATRRAQALARQQMEFVAAVSHELRTPLAVISSASDNLADGVAATPDQIKRYGELIRTQAKRLAGLVEQTLGFAGIQRGKVHFQRESVEVPDLLEQALHAAGVDQKEVVVEQHVEDNLPAVTADPAWMRQALRNLIANAAQYGGGWIGIDARRAAGGVEIAIADRGPGIAASDRARIFEPFYRGRNAAARNAQGAGLGLAIVKQVVEEHGGSVRVEAEPGSGTRFTLTLPAAEKVA
jgi:signal transduction histidine kinase